VQVKTGCLRKGVILFACWTSHGHRDGPSFRTYAGQIDFFAVYCPYIDAVFMVPIADVTTSGSLRIDRTKNRQSANVRWAASYLPAGNIPASVGARGAGEVPLRAPNVPL
jgi:hypothetical protein